MKHLLNDLSNEDKKSIREQHTGGMKVMTENFRKLLNSKHGDAKPLIEQNSENTQKSNVDKKIEEGYQKVSVVSLPDGKYIYQGSADICSIYDQDGKTETGYVVEMPYSIRGMWDPTPIEVRNKSFVGNQEFKTILFKEVGYKPQTNAPQNTKTLTNKVASEGIKNVTSQMMSDPPFPGEYSGYGFGGVFGGINYMWDCNGVEGMSGVRGMVDGIVLTETIENMLSYQDAEITDGKPGSPCVGFHSDQVKFIIYTSIDGKSKCKNY